MKRENLDQWQIKYLREYPFMPFGSMMNAFGQMHQQKPLSIDEFIKSAKQVFQACQEIVEGSLENSEPKRTMTDAYGNKSRLKKPPSIDELANKEPFKS